MERLNVITVPTTDLEGVYHTAFTVYDDSCEGLRASAGWTLRDAIEFYSNDYRVKRDAIKIVRPFVPQDVFLQNNGIRV